MCSCVFLSGPGHVVLSEGAVCSPHMGVGFAQVSRDVLLSAIISFLADTAGMGWNVSLKSRAVCYA